MDLFDILKTIVGTVAALSGMFIMVPQVVKTLRTKHVADLAWQTLGLYLFSCIAWFLYGILGRDIPIIGANVVAIIAGATQIYLKHKYTPKPALMQSHPIETKVGS